MKVLRDRSAYEQSGGMNVRGFGIEVGPHVMEILSGLYSDIPWAIVREYMTNMLDAHVADEGGHVFTRAPEVHLPNSLEPWIEFRDYGCGMDADTVWRVFPSYGASTKSGDDRHTGGFGIGAKAAFCYQGTDQWSVESRFNGERLSFVACRDENGHPSFVHASTVPCDEAAGISVRVPVAPEDFDDFRRAVARMLLHFPTKVEITGDDSFEYPEFRPGLRGGGWMLVPVGAGWIAGAEATAVVGSVPYPLHNLERDLLRDASREDCAKIELVLRSKVVVTFPVADIDVVPSREWLKATPRTIRTVRERLVRLHDEIKQAMESTLVGAESVLEASRLLWGMQASGIATWGHKRDGLDVYPGYVRPREEAVKQAGASLRVTGYTLNRNGTVGRTFYSKPSDMSVRFCGEEVDHIVFADTLSGAHARAKELCRMGSVDKALVFQGDNLTAESLNNMLYGLPFSVASELPAPPRAQRARTGRTGPTPHVRHTTASSDASSDPLPEGGIFIRMHRGKLDMEIAEYVGRVYLNALRGAGLVADNDILYEVNRAQARRLKAPAWRGVDAVIRDALAQPAIREKLVRLSAWRDFRNANRLLVNMATDAPEGSALGRLNALAVSADEERKLEGLLSLSGGSLLKERNAYVAGELNPLRDAALDEMPMLRVLVSLLPGYANAEVRAGQMREIVREYMAQCVKPDASPVRGLVVHEPMLFVA
jgi:hypothetical protein